MFAVKLRGSKLHVPYKYVKSILEVEKKCKCLNPREVSIVFSKFHFFSTIKNSEWMLAMCSINMHKQEKHTFVLSEVISLLPRIRRPE